jgi:uncharacterized membrane protein (DUF485 family)
MSWLDTAVEVSVLVAVFMFVIYVILLVTTEYGPKWVRRFVNTQWHRRWSKRRN